MQMYYDVLDIEWGIGEHNILVRTLQPEDKDSKNIAYMCCTTCNKMTEYHYPQQDTIVHMDLIDMEIHLHCEGFDVEWESGSLPADPPGIEPPA